MAPPDDKITLPPGGNGETLLHFTEERELTTLSRLSGVGGALLLELSYFASPTAKLRVLKTFTARPEPPKVQAC